MSASNHTYTVWPALFGIASGMGTPHEMDGREMEMSSSPPLITFTTSLRRKSGWMNSRCASMWASSGAA